MRAERVEVALQVGLPLERLLRGAVGDIGIDRNFRVHNQAAIAGQVQNHIGLAAFFVLTLILALDAETNSLGDAGGLEQMLKNHLAPISLDFVRTLQRTGEVFGLGADGLVQTGQGRNLGLQSVPLLAGLIHRLRHRALEVPKLILNRLEQILDRLLPCDQVALRLGLELREVRFCEL